MTFTVLCSVNQPVTLRDTLFNAGTLLRLTLSLSCRLVNAHVIHPTLLQWTSHHQLYHRLCKMMTPLLKLELLVHTALFSVYSVSSSVPTGSTYCTVSSIHCSSKFYVKILNWLMVVFCGCRQLPQMTLCSASAGKSTVYFCFAYFNKTELFTQLITKTQHITRWSAGIFMSNAKLRAILKL